MCRSVLFSLFLSFFVTVSSLAQFPLPFHVIPVVGKTKGGAGTDWISDVSIANVGKTSGTIGVHYFPAGRSNTFNGTFAKTLTLAKGESILVEDVIANWFPSFGTSTLGFLVIADMTPTQCGIEEPPPLGLIFSSRTYNKADPSRTYGQGVGSSLFAVNFTTVPSIITGVRHQPGVAPGYRSNAGVANLSTIPILLNITTYQDDGTVSGFAQKTVEPLSLGQWSLSDLGVTSLNSGRIEFQLDPSSIPIDECTQLEEGNQPACLDRCQEGCDAKYSFARSGAFLAYLSTVDNGSGDAVFYLPTMDWLAYNENCAGSAGAALVRMMWRFAFGPPPR